MKLTISQIKELINIHQETFTYIILSVITYFLCIHFSKDWFYYQFYFDNKIKSVEWHTFLSQITIFKEPLYLILTKLFGEMFGYSVYIFILTVVLLTIKLNYLRKIIQKHYTIGTFFYICFYIFLFEGTQLRVAYAVTFLIIAFYYLQKSKLFYTFFWILVASQVHITALAFMIILPLYFIRSLNIAVYMAFITVPLLILFDTSLLSSTLEFISKLNPKYIIYFDQKTLATQNSTGLYLYFIAFFAFILAIIFYYLKPSILNNRFMQTMLLTSLSGVIAMVLFHDYVVIGARLGELLLLPIVVLLSYLYIFFYDNKMHTHQIALVLLSFIYFSARLVYLYPTMFYR